MKSHNKIEEITPKRNFKELLQSTETSIHEDLLSSKIRQYGAQYFNSGLLLDLLKLKEHGYLERPVDIDPLLALYLNHTPAFSESTNKYVANVFHLFYGHQGAFLKENTGKDISVDLKGDILRSICQVLGKVKDQDNVAELIHTWETQFEKLKHDQLELEEKKHDDKLTEGISTEPMKDKERDHRDVNREDVKETASSQLQRQRDVETIVAENKRLMEENKALHDTVRVLRKKLKAIGPISTPEPSSTQERSEKTTADCLALSGWPDARKVTKGIDGKYREENVVQYIERVYDPDIYGPFRLQEIRTKYPNLYGTLSHYRSINDKEYEDLSDTVKFISRSYVRTKQKSKGKKAQH